MVGSSIRQEPMMSAHLKTTNERVSLLGPRSLLSGDFATTEELVILGQLDGGRVQAPSVTIGPTAHVTADIHTGTIRIEGVVVGDIFAELSVTVHATAIVEGHVYAPLITVQEGATINGTINQDPQAADGQNVAEPRAAPLRAARRAR
jgi:cytoskeletal protein CcmA (bactofilin family)